MAKPFILTSDYNLPGSQILLEIGRDCFAVDSKNNIYFIGIVYDSSCYDGMAYDLITYDEAVGYKRERKGALYDLLETGELKIVNIGKPIDDEAWQYDNLPLTKIFYLNELSLSNEDLSAIIVDIHDTIFYKLMKNNILTDDEIYDIIENSQKEYRESLSNKEKEILDKKIHTFYKGRMYFAGIPLWEVNHTEEEMSKIKNKKSFLVRYKYFKVATWTEGEDEMKISSL